MNVGLLTWFHYHNYGTALQVTALSHVIREMGCPVDVIHYQPQGERRFLLSDDVVSYYADRIKGAVKGFVWGVCLRQRPDLGANLF